MKRFFAMFALTPSEQRVVIFVLLIFLGWTWLKHQQEVRRETTAVFGSPMPNEQ